MAPITTEAHAALWQTVLTSDLVGTVRTYAMPLDDPLPFLLTDQRLVRTTDLNDNVWCNVRDVPACFGRAPTAPTTTWSSRSTAPAGGSARPACPASAPGRTSSPTAPDSAPCCSAAWPRQTLVAGPAESRAPPHRADARSSSTRPRLPDGF